MKLLSLLKFNIASHNQVHQYDLDHNASKIYKKHTTKLFWWVQTAFKIILHEVRSGMVMF